MPFPNVLQYMGTRLIAQPTPDSNDCKGCFFTPGSDRCSDTPCTPPHFPTDVIWIEEV